MPADDIGMKEQLLTTVKEMKEDGHDFEEEPIIFKWSYPEEPFTEFQLLITETEQASFSFGDVVSVH